MPTARKFCADIERDRLDDIRYTRHAHSTIRNTLGTHTTTLNHPIRSTAMQSIHTTHTYLPYQLQEHIILDSSLSFLANPAFTFYSGAGVNSALTACQPFAFYYTPCFEDTPQRYPNLRAFWLGYTELLPNHVSPPLQPLTTHAHGDPSNAYLFSKLCTVMFWFLFLSFMFSCSCFLSSNGVGY